MPKRYSECLVSTRIRPRLEPTTSWFAGLPVAHSAKATMSILVFCVFLFCLLCVVFDLFFFCLFYLLFLGCLCCLCRLCAVCSCCSGCSICPHCSVWSARPETQYECPHKALEKKKNPMSTMAPVMTFFQILPAQIGLPTRGGSVNLAPHRNPAWPCGHSHLA